MTGIFLKIVNMSITASYVALMVILVRMLLKKAPKVFSYILWSVVFIRLVCPFDFTSSLSLLRPLNNSLNYASERIEIVENPTVLINNEAGLVNHALPEATSFASMVSVNVLVNLFTVIWILGIVVLTIYCAYSYIKVNKIVKFSTLVRNNIYTTDQILSPFVFGFIKPKIYLPKGLKGYELNYIITHERTHIKRYDYLIKPISFLVLTLHWFNPLMWISYYLMVKDMEMSCDESVLKKLGGDVRGDYSYSLLTLSAKQSGLLLPLAFGESNIKSRIKNVLNYKKPGFWTILLAIVILMIIAIGLLTNPMEISAKDRAEKFLEKYYTIDNTEIADILFDFIADPNNEIDEEGIIQIKGVQEAILDKYGDLMTESALDNAIANRIILAGEMTAKDYGSKLLPESINLDKISDDKDAYYQYSVFASVIFKDNSEERVDLHGVLTMKEVESKWKVEYFKPDREELINTLRYGKANLFITNLSNESIRKVEVSTKTNSGGVMNADNTDIVKNERLDFEMSDGEGIDFTVRLLDGNDNTLLEQSFTEDFSKGKDVDLFIKEDSEGKLIIVK